MTRDSIGLTGRRSSARAPRRGRRFTPACGLRLVVAIGFSVAAGVLSRVVMAETPAGVGVSMPPASVTALPFPQATVPAATEACEGMVWQVEGARTRIFLAGSVHLGSAAEGEAAWPAPLEYAWAQCRRVVFEVNPREIGMPAQANAVLRAGRLPSGKNLWFILPSDTAALLDRSVKGQGLRNRLAGMRPWMAALTVHESVLVDTGVTREHGLENVMFRRAQRDRKEVGGLVSPVEQIQSLATLSSAQGIAFLHSTLESLPGANDSVEAMTRAWRRGDGAWLENNVARSFEGRNDLYERFMRERNRQWAATIAGFPRDQSPVLVVVGCLHLAGPDNVRQCLARHGFKVTPVTTASIDRPSPDASRPVPRRLLPPVSDAPALAADTSIQRSGDESSSGVVSPPF